MWRLAERPSGPPTRSGAWRTPRRAASASIWTSRRRRSICTSAGTRRCYSKKRRWHSLLYLHIHFTLSCTLTHTHTHTHSHTHSQLPVKQAPQRGAGMGAGQFSAHLAAAHTSPFMPSSPHPAADHGHARLHLSPTRHTPLPASFQLSTRTVAPLPAACHPIPGTVAPLPASHPTRHGCTSPCIFSALHGHGCTSPCASCHLNGGNMPRAIMHTSI